MSSISAKKIYDLDNMNEASRLAGGLGTLLMGGATVPAVGTLSVQNTLKYSVAPAVKSATATHAALTLLVGAQPGITSGIVQPDVPRTMTIKGNDANVAGNVVIHGTSISDAVVSDTIAANGSTEVLGVVAFKTVTSIDFPPYAVAGTETISIGRGAGIGFPAIIDNAAMCTLHDFDNANDAGSVVADATLQKSVYLVAGTMDSSKQLDLVFVTF